jgi:hypothetical protein
MPGICGLHGIYAQRPDGVDRKLLDGIAFQGWEICGGLGHGQPSSLRVPDLGGRGQIGGRRRTGMPECTLSPTTLRVKNRPRITADAAPRYPICEAGESVNKPDIGWGWFVTGGDRH